MHNWVSSAHFTVNTPWFKWVWNHWLWVSLAFLPGLPSKQPLVRLWVLKHSIDADGVLLYAENIIAHIPIRRTLILLCASVAQLLLKPQFKHISLSNYVIPFWHLCYTFLHCSWLCYESSVHKNEGSMKFAWYKYIWAQVPFRPLGCGHISLQEPYVVLGDDFCTDVWFLTYKVRIRKFKKTTQKNNTRMWLLLVKI